MIKGVFKDDLDVWLVRDAVFGFLDLANIQRLLNGESSSEPAYDDLFGMIAPMVLKDGKKERCHTDNSSKRLRILAAAERLFAEKGYGNATIQEIAALAAVGDGTVYDYFRNKEDVLFNVLKEGFNLSPQRKGFQDHLAPEGEKDGEGRMAIRKIEGFIRRFFRIGLVQPSFAKIFIIHGIYNKSFYSSDSFSDFSRYMEQLDRFIEEGKKEKSVRGTVTPEVVRLLVLGAFSHQALRWLITGGKKAIDKAGEINAMTELVIRSIAEV
jgi:TetR/AcrR family fatty acid metabolism transcriptional regulator